MDDRIEVRIEKDLRKRLSLFCRAKEISQSEMIREAIEQYLDLGSFKAALGTIFQNKDFHDSFVALYDKHPAFAEFIEDFYGLEEEILVLKSPRELLWAVEKAIVTKTGKKAFTARCRKEHTSKKK